MLTSTKILSKEEMKSVTGGDIDMTYYMACFVNYYRTCMESMGPSGDWFCNDSAEEYCLGASQTPQG